MSQPLATFQGLELEPEFPCRLYATSSSLYRDVIFCHWHEAFECILVPQGILRLTVDQQTLELAAGEAAWVHPGEIHFGNPADGGYCAARALVFSPGFLDCPADDRSQARHVAPLKQGQVRLPRHLVRPDHVELLDLLEDLPPVMDGRLPGWELVVRARLLEFLARLQARNLLLPGAAALEADAARERLKRALAYLSRNHAHKVRMAGAAEAAALSEDYFYRFFKKHTRMSPVEYLTRYRLQEAKKLLQSTDLSVTQVGLAVGFEQTGHFIRTFGRQAGCTPGEFRRRHLQAGEAAGPGQPGLLG